MKKLVIVGASGHGKVIADIAEKNGYNEIIFLDDNTTIAECADFPVVGTSKDVAKYQDYECVVAIGNPRIRASIQKEIPESRLATLIHPAACISRRVQIGKGTVVMAGAVINSDATIGKGCIVNTCASVDHDCILQDYVHVSVGAHIAGTCVIGESTWIGARAVVNNNISICSNCMIGAAAAVVTNIEEAGTYVGIPAQIR